MRAKKFYWPSSVAINIHSMCDAIEKKECMNGRVCIVSDYMLIS